MKITRISRLTGKTHEWNIDGITPDEWNEAFGS